MREGCSPVRQKKRGQAADRVQAIQEEVKLMKAEMIKEVHYHDWLSNPVMVKKHDDSWRMCIDFKDLNKTCPKDGYPLPEIDWKVETLCGFPFKCFWTHTKAIIKYKWQKKTRKKQLSLRANEYFATQRCLLACRMPELLTSMAHPVQNINHSAFRVEKKMHVIEQPIPPAPAADSEANVLAEWNALSDAHNEVVVAVLLSECKVFIARFIAVMIFTAHNANKVLQNAFTAIFDFMALIMERCFQLIDHSASFLLPSFMIFVG
nr:reverse transcriptase domain-containing protein [Tanacetum cinerariifolium]